MANFAYPPSHNLINMDQSHFYGRKPHNMEQHSTYNHYNIATMDCKTSRENYNNMPNQFGDYYNMQQGAEASQNFISPMIEEQRVGANFYSKSETVDVQGSQVQDTDLIQNQRASAPKSDKKSILFKKIEDREIKCKESVYAASDIQLSEVAVPILKKKALQFEKTNGLFYCDLCEYSSQKVSSVKSHRMIHTGERPFKCDLCTKSFRQKEHLKNHRLTHTREKLFFCNECSYSCGVRGSMDLHKLIHRGIKPYVCTKCDYRCRRPFEMKKHKAKCESVFRKCDSCDRTFSKKTALAIHRITHLEYLKFSCRLCEYTAKLRSRFKSHLSKMHPEKTFFVCQSCDFCSSKKKSFKKHKLSHTDKRKWFKCDSCLFSSSTKSALKEHVLTHADDDTHNDTLNADEKESISILDPTSGDITLLDSTSGDQNALKNNEGNLDEVKKEKFENDYLCNKNNTFNGNVLNGNSHLSNQNQDPAVEQSLPALTKDPNCLYYCDVCDFSSRRLSSVKVHKYLHTGERPFLCDACPASYTRRQHLQKHKTLHASGKDAKVARSMKLYACSACSFSCAHKGNLQKHQLLHAEKDPNCERGTVVARPKKFPCNICKLKFGLENQLVKHLKSHVDKINSGEVRHFQYDSASAKSLLDQYNEFIQLNNIVSQGKDNTSERYIDICKKINDVYCCNLCDFTTKRLTSIKVHYLLHTGEKPYKCDMCPASYRRKQHLQNHRVRHTKETMYLCHLCDFTSVLKSGMETHRKTHDDAKMFTCPTCDFACLNSKELEAHQETCELHMCSVCPEIFFDRNSLEAHEASHEASCGSEEADKAKGLRKHEDGLSDECIGFDKPLTRQSALKTPIEKLSKPTGEELDEVFKPEFDRVSVKEESCDSGSNFSDVMDHRLDDFDRDDSDDNEDAKIPKEEIPNDEACSEEVTDDSCVKKSKKPKRRKVVSYTIRKYKRNQHKRINGLYHCEFCDYSNKRLNSVKVHRMIHTGERPFLCDVCSATFRQKEHLINHKNTHTTDKTFSCEQCGFTTKRKVGLIKHQMLHKEKSFVCVKCGYRCRMKSVLDKHEITCRDKVLKCNMCDDTFPTQSELVSHRIVHIELKTYSCELCDFSASNLLHLKRHTVVHSKVLYLCYICSFTTVHKTNMQKHRLTHNEKSKDEPDGADVRQESPHNLSESVMKHVVREKTPAEMIPLLNSVYQNLQSASLNLMVSERNKMEPPQEPAFDRPYQNPPKQQQGRPKKYKTGEFKKENDLYFCDFCDYSNTRVNSLKVHRMIHTDERPFPCDLCPKSFRQKMHLRNHKITHTKEKLFFCNICSFSCGYKASLDLHKLKHTGVKPYVCERCLYSCRRPVEMERHEKICGVLKGI